MGGVSEFLQPEPSPPRFPTSLLFPEVDQSGPPATPTLHSAQAQPLLPHPGARHLRALDPFPEPEGAQGWVVAPGSLASSCRPSGIPHWSSLVMSNAPVLSWQRQGCGPATCPAVTTYVARGHRRQEEGTLAPVAKRAALGERGPGQSDPEHARKTCSGSHTLGWLVGSWVWVL